MLCTYYLLPLILRKQLTNCSIFRTKNKSEWENICDELLNLDKKYRLQLFDYVFDKSYTHLDIDTLNGNLQKNFNKLEIDY